jgi:thiol-disulfide isomerase/thioredoxin
MPKTARGHQQSSAAKMFPPLDVHSKEDIAKAIKQIMKGPVTILLVYADWCGHCHDLMPHWDAAANSPNRTVPSIKLNEKNTEEFNSALNSLNKKQSSVHVSAYPTVLVLDNKGNKITDVQGKKDTESLTQLMNRSGPLAEQAGLSQPKGAPKGLSQPKEKPKEMQEFSRPQEQESEEGLAAQGMQGMQAQGTQGMQAQGMQKDLAASLEPLSLPLASPPRREPVVGGAHHHKSGLYRLFRKQTHKNRQ